MNRLFALGTLLVAAAFAAPAAVTAAPAHEGCHSTAKAVAPLPSVEVIEEGDQSLRLICLPAPDATSTEVTLVYEREGRATSVTVDPDLVASSQAETFDAFLDSMDEAFVSYVRATLADKLLHAGAPASVADRAVASLFFPRAATPASVARFGGLEPAVRAE